MTITDSGAPPPPDVSEKPPENPPAPPALPERPSACYIINVLLLAVVWAGIAGYVRVHFGPGWRDQWAAWVGGGVSIWTFFETANSVLQRFGKNLVALSTNRMRNWLKRAAATWIIGAALVATAAAFAVTSSIFLYRDEDKNADVVKVQITPSSFEYNDLVLDGTHRVAGGRMYFVQTTRLFAKTLKPHRQCEAESIAFHMGSSVKFAYPSRMPCFQYHVVRLMPVGSLWDVLPSVGGNLIQAYYVQVQIAGRRYPNMPQLLRRQVIEIGAPFNELPQQLDDDAKADIMKTYAVAFPGIPEVQLRESVNNVTAAPPLPIGTPKIDNGTIVVSIYDRVDATTPVGQTIPVSISDQSTTIPIDWKTP